MAQEQEHLRGEAKQPDDESEAQVIDVRTVIKMFKELQVKVSESATKEDSQKDKELQVYKRKTQVLSGIVQRMSTMYEDLERKTDQLELRSMRRAIVITGLQTDDSVLKCMNQVYGFMEQHLQLDINIIDCFKLGNGKERPVVITVESIKHRAEVFYAMEQYKKQLQETDEEQTVFINDYLPAEIKERRRKERDIFKRNEKEVANKLPMTIGRGGLRIQGENFEQKIQAPDPTDVLNYTEEQLDQVYKMELKPGEKVVHQGTTMISYVVPVNSLQMIDRAYMKMRLTHPKAKSIICSFSVPGMPRYLHEDFCDDKEIDGGRFLMSLMKRSKISNAVVFVARYYKLHEKIGSKRFELMENAVVSAFERNPFNRFTNANQSIVRFEKRSTGAGNNSLNGLRNQSSSNVCRYGVRGHGRGEMRGHMKRYDRGQGGRGQPVDRHKRRRQESPNSGKSFVFDAADPPKFSFTTPQIIHTGWNLQDRKDDESSLGASWPSLQHGAANG